MKLQQIKKLVGNKIFSAEFTKKDGTTRKMICRLGVKKHLKGGTKKYDAESMNLLTVYSLDTQGYRTINVDTLTMLKCGKTYTI